MIEFKTLHSLAKDLFLRIAVSKDGTTLIIDGDNYCELDKEELGKLINELQLIRAVLK